MDAILSFFSDLILFTAGLAVAAMWIIIFIVMVDEAIDLAVYLRNRNKQGRDDAEADLR